MRNMSFSMTTPQFIDGSKDITRRFGWWFLKPGDQLWGVEKAMGLKKGEKIKRLASIEIVSVREETLRHLIDDFEYGMEELKREGFPFGCTSPGGFVDELLKRSKHSIDDKINRIEFRKTALPLLGE